MKILAFCISLVSVAGLSGQSAARSVWDLQSSTVTYHLTHAVHELDGTSHQSRGRGICENSRCEFLIATPVKSFDSGDTNRDLHMLQTVRGAEFPMVTVRFTIPESAVMQPAFTADLDVRFAGQQAHYSNVRFKQTISGEQHTITGTIPATVKDFRIDPPRFLTLPIHNEIPVKVEATWQKAAQ